jgi:hypothetical protein
MPAGYGFESYPQQKSPVAAQVGQQLQMSAQQAGPMGPPGLAGPMDDPAQMAAEPVFSPLPGQTTGNPVTRPELVVGGDSSTSAAVGQLLSRTAGGAGKTMQRTPPNVGQDELLLRSGFSPEELELFKQMGGVK